jgi:hypothetical protein
MLVVVVLACFGAGIIFTARERTERAHRATCAKQLRAIGQGSLLYANDHGGAFPPTLGTLIVVADVNPQLLVCPSANDPIAPGTRPVDFAAAIDADPARYGSYVYVGGPLNATSPAECVVAYERRHTNHAEQGIHVLYADGSVTWVDEKTAKHIEAEVTAGHNPPRPAVP